MKKKITILTLFIVFLANAQTTYIPMPEGYGTYGSEFKPKHAMPFFENNGYIYCYTQNSATGYYVGRIAKVNVATNDVTILSGEIRGAETPTFIRTNNGMIYFKSSSFNMLYQINPATNSVINFSETYLGNNQVLADYAFINNKLYFTPNGPAQVYDFTGNTMTELKYYDTPSHFYYLTISGISINNGIYLTGRYFNESSTAFNKTFKLIDPGNTVSLLSTTNNSYNSHHWFRDFSRFIKINNSLLTLNRVTQNGVMYNTLESINLTNNTVNTNYFTYADISGTTPLAPYIFNSMVYITDGDKVYVSDGSSTPVLTNLPAFLTDQITSLSPELPLIGSGQNPIFQSNNKIIGQRNHTPYSVGNPSTSELWISDGTLSGTKVLKKFKSYYQSPYLITLFANNSIYFHEKSHYEGSYLYKTDDTPEGTYPVYQFDNSVNIDHNFYSSGKFLYYSTYLNNGNSGLYKIDLSQLSQLYVKDKAYNNYLILYPNPVKNFITLQNKDNSTESFEYNIVDLTARIVKKGNAKFEEKINIESLASGNYIILIETEDGEKLTQKIIKD